LALYLFRCHLNGTPHLSNVPSGSDWKLGGKLPVFLNIDVGC